VARQIVLAQLTVDLNAVIYMMFQQQIVDGDLVVVETNVRRMIIPGQDPEVHFDDLDSYFAMKGYPPIQQHDKDMIHGLIAMARSHPTLVANGKKYAAEQAALRSTAEPEPEAEATLN